MYFELKENKPHGTKDDPFSTYHIKNKGRSFQIPVHWHDELEIIYVKSGFLTVSISGESYIGKAGDAFVVSPGSLHLMGSQTGTVDYFTFLFPLKYISFFTDDMLDDKLLEPLNSGHLMICPRVKDTAKELCEQLIDIYMAKTDESESKIAAQIKTKVILLQFILEMWEKGLVIENDTNGRNIVDGFIYTAELYREDIPKGIWRTVSSFRKIYITVFQGTFLYYTVAIYYIFTVGACKTAVTGYRYAGYGGSLAEWVSECKLFYQKFQKSLYSFTTEI